MNIQNILERLKITELNTMQEEAISSAKKHNEILLLSATGSGKTLAFLLPVLTSLEKNKKGVQALIMVPSRELALQIEQVFKQMNTGFKINCCYGGHSTRIEKNNLEQAPALLVGTPGRIAYHIRKNNFDPNPIHFLVLDEFDKSLEFGFQEDMSFIISHLKQAKKRILTSATQMAEIPDFTGVSNIIKLNYLTDAPKPAGLQLKYVRTTSKEKLNTLLNLICKTNARAALVFCNHREAVERISFMLHKKGLEHAVFHGGMEQDDRERALIKFRNGSHKILVTTDLASRGLDIPEIEIVVHYQLPQTEDTFIHRNGRTARMNAEGTSYLFLAEEEFIPKFITDKIEEEKIGDHYPMLEKPFWSTLYIGAGKKDKINKTDIVGMLLQKGKLQKDELGLIEVLDHSAYAAIKRSKINTVTQLIKNEKIKNRKIKIEISE